MNRIKADLERMDLLERINENITATCSEFKIDPRNFTDFTQLFSQVIGQFGSEQVKKLLQQIQHEGLNDRYPFTVIQMIAEKRKRELEGLEWSKQRNAGFVANVGDAAQMNATEEQQFQVSSSGDSGMQVVKSVLFDDAVQCDFYQNENNDVFMTRKQIGEALGYNDPQKAIDKIHERNRERLGKYSVAVKLTGTDGKQYNTTLYSAKGVYEICRWSRQPKADAFFDWVYDVLEDLRKGQLQIQPTNTNVNYEFQQQELEIRLRETKLKEAEMFIKMAERFEHILPNQMVQSILANAAKTVGYDVSMFAPEQNKRVQAYMTATDIALETGSTSHMIGVLSNQHKLKRVEYGRWISAFVYNERGKRKLLELLQKEDMRNIESIMVI